ncbi:hypothetical protein [Synechocystis sp. PCC 7509]|uniref:hypothetical protein n=1 Tax=Synechocystis sp. PCC 7509 TaxID=927677 RepID=UPI0002ABC6A0|nr:hypothetical protein [Synechocystis sp. PCC 7509]
MKRTTNTLITFLVLATVEALSLVIATTAKSAPLPVAQNNQTEQQKISPASPSDELLLPFSTELAPAKPITELAPVEPIELAPVEPIELAPVEPIELAPVEPITEPEPNPLPPPAEPLNTIAPESSGNTQTPPTEAISEPETQKVLSALEVRILTPKNASVLNNPATSVILQYLEGSKVELKINGVNVDPNFIGRTEIDSKSKIVTQTWYGIAFNPGNNTLTAQATRDGKSGEIATVKLQVRGTATQIKLQTTEARIPADGRSTATIQGELQDAEGNRSEQNAIVTLVASAGEFVGVDANPDSDGFQVKAEKGQFTAQLRSVLQAQTVRIAAQTTNIEVFTQVQFETNLRPSLVTGVIDLRLGKRGTDYYSSFRDFLPPDGNNKTQLDFRSAVFATGRIGDWLFTGAYNSDRTLNEDCNGNSRLFRDENDCTEKYPVYGDNSTVEATTPSQDSLYLRIERNSRILGAEPDFAMWGDYNTEEFSRSSQEYTAFNRKLHGFKANYNLGDLQVTGFYANNVEGFQRDTIAPDGTSGYYFLSRRLLISGSESVFIEVEELNRPGTVLQRQQLSRGPDYEIDYDRGTLLFRQAVLRTAVDEEGRILVRRIVTTYQYESQDGTSSIYGGRVQYHLARELGRESWIGATYLTEHQGVRDFELYGADARFAIGPKGFLIAEYAHSTNESDVMGKVSGSAYRIEAEGEIAKNIQARAFYRSADPGFANDATISFVPGQTRYGADVTAKISDTTNLRVQYDREKNFGIAPQVRNTLEELLTPGIRATPGSAVDNSLTTISAGVQQRIGKADLTVDWIHRDRTDRIPETDLNSTSDQLRSRLNLPLTNTLSFVAQNELTFSSDVDAVYPDRTLFGLSWKALPGVNISLSQQFFTRGQYSGNSITSLDVSGEHKFGSDTTLTGRYSMYGGGDGLGGSGAIGIKQGWTIAPGLKANFAYEHVFGDFFGKTAAGTQFAQPFAPGQSASSIGVDGGDSYSVGLDYTDNPNFQANARYEHRNSSGGSNTVLSASATGKITPSITALARYQQANSSNQTLEGLGTTRDLKIGLAYRDINSDKFNALLRYEYRKNPSTNPETILFGSGTGSEDHTFALEGIYAPSWRWEFYGKYALRSSTSYLADDLVGTSTINLTQLRATYRPGYKWDVVGEARLINQPSAGYSETGFLLEAGYYLTPNLRLAGGYAFGNVDDDGFSGSRSASGPYLGLTVKLNELFDGFGLQKVAPPQQQESQKTPLARKLTQRENAIALWDRNNDSKEELEFSGAEVDIDLQISQLAFKVKQLLHSYQQVNSSPTPDLAISTQIQRLDKPTLPLLLRGEKL